jgi:hypothetical protein
MEIYSERFEVPRTQVPKRITMSRVARREPSTERRVAASPGERLCNGLFDATQIVRYDNCLQGPNVNWNSVQYQDLDLGIFIPMGFSPSPN